MVKVKENNPEVQKPIKFTIDLGVAYDDELLKAKDFQDFLQTHMKVNGKKGNLGESVTWTSSGKLIQVVSKRRVSKRYLKYLTKKFLKKNGILEYLKVISTNKATYEIRYIKYDGENEEEQ